MQGFDYLAWSVVGLQVMPFAGASSFINCCSVNDYIQ